MDLQSLINDQPANGTLKLPPGESFGQVIIDRPLTIVGQGKATWIGALSSPALTITVPGVTLRNVMVEVTSDLNGIAIFAEPGTEPFLEDVTVKGKTSGIPESRVISLTVSFLPPPPISAPTSGSSPPQPDPRRSSPPAPPSHDPLVSLAAAPPVGADSVFPNEWAGDVKRPRILGWKATIAIAGSIVGLLILLFFTLGHMNVTTVTRKDSRIESLEKDKHDLETKLRVVGIDLQRAWREKERLERETAKLQEKIKSLEQTVTRSNYIPTTVSADELFRLAREGNPTAQYRIGVYHSWGFVYNGRSFEKNDSEAMKWLQMAANLGHPEAPSVLERLRQTTASKPEDSSTARFKTQDQRPHSGQKARDPSKDAQLIDAIKLGNVALVKQHVSEGASVNARVWGGNTPLTIAAFHGRVDMVKYLLDQGADANAVPSDGWTALYCAAAHRHAEIVRLLLAKGANPNIPDGLGQTPLKMATANGYSEIVALLRGHGAR